MQRFSADEISITPRAYQRCQHIAAGEGMAPATIGTAAMRRGNCSAAADRVTAMTITRKRAPPGASGAAPRERSKMEITMKDRVAVVPGGSKGICLGVWGPIAGVGRR